MQEFSRIVDGLLNNSVSATFTYLIVGYLVFALFKSPVSGSQDLFFPFS